MKPASAVVKNRIKNLVKLELAQVRLATCLATIIVTFGALVGSPHLVANDKSKDSKDGAETSVVVKLSDSSLSEVELGKATSKPTVTPKTGPTLSRTDLARKSAIERCLSIYFTRPVDADALRPWSLMHGLLAYGRETLLSKSGRGVNAVEYLCNNGIGDDRRLIFLHDGEMVLNVGRGYQGHAGQLLAMLAQSRVPMNQPMTVEGKKFTVRDLVETEMRECKSGDEQTFKLIGISHYIDSDVNWKNRRGETWNIARLIQEELAQPINGAACGGVHRLMGLSYAVKTRQFQRKPLNGPWLAAQNKVQRYQQIAFATQNQDGSFSSDWFEKPNSSISLNRKINTTGHMLEWLAFSMTTDQLKHPKFGKSVDQLVYLLLKAPNYNLDVGPRGHAIRGLRLFEAKVFGPSDFQQLARTQPVNSVTDAEAPDHFMIPSDLKTPGPKTLGPKAPVNGAQNVYRPSNGESGSRVRLFNRRRR